MTADASLRHLERLAAQGDADAARKLEVERARLGRCRWRWRARALPNVSTFATASQIASPFDSVTIQTHALASNDPAAWFDVIALSDLMASANADAARHLEVEDRETGRRFLVGPSPLPRERAAPMRIEGPFLDRCDFCEGPPTGNHRSSGGARWCNWCALADITARAERSRLPGWHPQHVCGLYCDGQDGASSVCARQKREGPPTDPWACACGHAHAAHVNGRCRWAVGQQSCDCVQG